MDIIALRFPNHGVGASAGTAAAAAMMLRARFPSPQFFHQQAHFFGACSASSAVDDMLPACPDIGIDFDSCSLDIFSCELVAALSRAVSAGFAGAPTDGSVDTGAGTPEAGDGGAFEVMDGKGRWVENVFVERHSLLLETSLERARGGRNRQVSRAQCPWPLTP